MYLSKMTNFVDKNEFCMQKLDKYNLEKCI